MKNRFIFIISFLTFIIFFMHILNGSNHLPAQNMEVDAIDAAKRLYDEGMRNKILVKNRTSEQIIVNNQEYQFPLLDALPEGEDARDYIALSYKKAEYCVKPGDSLWKIARDYCGEGRAWKTIKEANADLLGDSDRLLIDMVLQIPEYKYIKWQTNSYTRGYNDSLAFQFDAPASFIGRYPKWEACLTSFSSQDQSVAVYSHVMETRFEKNEFTSSFEKFTEQIQEGAKRSDSGNCISELEFETCTAENGLDLYLYTFTVQTDQYQNAYAVCYLLGEQYQAEFIGSIPILGEKEKANRFPIENLVRYMAASFFEKGGERSGHFLKFKPYIGEENWPLESLHNPFAMSVSHNPFGEVVHNDSLTEDTIADVEEMELSFQSSIFESLLKGACIVYYNMDEQQQKELCQRKLRTGDLAWITSIEILWGVIKINNYAWYDVKASEIELDSLKDLQGLVNLKNVYLEMRHIDDYSPLADLPNLTDVYIAVENDDISLEWLRNMPQLESFVMRHLYTKESDATFREEEDYVEEDKGKTLNSSPFINCKNLKYLEWEVHGTPDVSFLDALPNLYAFCLYGEEENEQESLKRQDLFTESSCPQIKCLVVDKKWLRNLE